MRLFAKSLRLGKWKWEKNKMLDVEVSGLARSRERDIHKLIFIYRWFLGIIINHNKPFFSYKASLSILE